MSQQESLRLFLQNNNLQQYAPHLARMDIHWRSQLDLRSQDDYEGCNSSGLFSGLNPPTIPPDDLQRLLQAAVKAPVDRSWMV